MRPSRTSAVVLWSAVQCAALVLAAAGVHLWPHHPDPPESIALAELVTIQVFASALLFPVLFADGANWVVSVALLIPMEQLAGLLSAAPEAVMWMESGYVALWVVGLAGWARLARSDLTRACLTAAATLLSLGGCLLWYVAAEAAAQAGRSTPDPSDYGTLMASVMLSATCRPPHLVAWTVAGSPLLTSLAAAAWIRTRPTPRHPPHFPTPLANG